MAALNTDKWVYRRDGQILGVPVKGGIRIYKGGMVCTSLGLAVPASDSPGLRFAGFAIEGVDNTDGDDRERTVRVWQTGIFPVHKANASAMDVGIEVASVDDQTVETLNITANDVRVGRIVRTLDTNTVEIKIDSYAF